MDVKILNNLHQDQELSENQAAMMRKLPQD